MNSASYPSTNSAVDYAAALAEAEQRIQMLTADQERARWSTSPTGFAKA